MLSSPTSRLTKRSSLLLFAAKLSRTPLELESVSLAPTKTEILSQVLYYHE